MIKTLLAITFIFSTLLPFYSNSAEPTFNKEKDLLLLHFDLKTDVDDVHTIAALDLILQSNTFKDINYYAVSGTYGKQGGLYVPANNLFDIVFNKNWTDAHMHRQQSINNVVRKITQTLSSNGLIWITEAGQSDFTQTIIQELDKNNISFTKAQMIVAQHSTWNENETSEDALTFVKNRTSYNKIPDGNAIDNGTPGFNNEKYSVSMLENKAMRSSKAWIEANKVSTKYNGVNGRYNNKAISSGGADFSDLVEVVWILGINDVPTVAEFFTTFNMKK